MSDEDYDRGYTDALDNYSGDYDLGYSDGREGPRECLQKVLIDLKLLRKYDAMMLNDIENIIKLIEEELE